MHLALRTRWKAHNSNVRSSPVTSLSFKGEVPVRFHPVSQMKGSRGSLVLFHSDFLYAQELTEVPVLGSKETFLAKGRDGFQMSPLNVSSAVGVALISGWESPTDNTRLRGKEGCHNGPLGLLFCVLVHGRGLLSEGGPLSPVPGARTGQP